MAFGLSFVGIVLFIIGIIMDMHEGNVMEGIVFWVIGTIVAIPGFYFTYKVWQAYKSDDKTVRQSILNEIPDM